MMSIVEQHASYRIALSVPFVPHEYFHSLFIEYAFYMHEKLCCLCGISMTITVNSLTDKPFTIV